MTIVYAGLFVSAALLLDWAMFDRLMTSGEVLWSVKPGYRYRDTLFPRVVVTIISAMIFGFAAIVKPTDAWLALIGAAGFAASVLQAIISTSLRQRRLDA